MHQSLFFSTEITWNHFQFQKITETPFPKIPQFRDISFRVETLPRDLILCCWLTSGQVRSSG